MNLTRYLVFGNVLHRKQRLSPLYLTVVRNQMFREASAQIAYAKMAFDGEYRKEGAAIVSELLKKGSICGDAYYRLVGRKIGAELLSKNVFALHFDSDEVTFQSTLIKSW